MREPLWMKLAVALLFGNTLLRWTLTSDSQDPGTASTPAEGIPGTPTAPPTPTRRSIRLSNVRIPRSP